MRPCSASPASPATSPPARDSRAAGELVPARSPPPGARFRSSGSRRAQADLSEAQDLDICPQLGELGFFSLVRMANDMPELFGTGYPRAGLLRRVGRLEQVAGVRLVTLGDGLGRGVRVLEFRTGTGFAFEVLVDRCFDVGRCELSGQPLSWLSGAGVTGPWYYEPDEWGWFRAWGGGMVVTCGSTTPWGRPTTAPRTSASRTSSRRSATAARPGRRPACPADRVRRAVGRRRVRALGGRRGPAVRGVRRAARAPAAD